MSVRDAWQTLARRGKEYCDDGYDRGWSSHWAVWAPIVEPRASALEDNTDRFALAIGKGLHCAGIAADAAWLPPDLVTGADYTLLLGSLTRDDISVVARDLCGCSPDEFLTDEQAASLTPRLLRLARRPGQTATEYVRKLRVLLERDAVVASEAPTTSTSPRDAPTLGRLHGMDEAVVWGLAVARDLEAYSAGRLAWADVDRGCLLSGPPGCGKTLYARALAATCGVPLVTGSYSEWLATGSAHQGDLLKAMRKTFATARSSAPAILFVDEIDSFPNRGTITHHFAEWEIQVVNALLAEIDGAAGRDGVIFIAACNHPDRLDPALLRSGRLDRHVRIGMPNRAALAAILREHLGVDLPGEELFGAALAAAGASGADCERLVRGARRRARTANRAMVMGDLLSEIGGADDRSDEDLWLAAIHEAGHVVAASTLRPGSVGMVTLRANAASGGFTALTPAPSPFIRPSDLLERLIILLAGRASEEAIFGTASSGAGGSADSDLGRATAIAVTASTALGLDRRGGLVWRGLPDAHLLPGALTADLALAARVRETLDSAYAEACELIQGRVDAVQAVAVALLERHVLDGRDAETIARQHVPRKKDGQ
jgi:hypothetical protein